MRFHVPALPGQPTAKSNSHCAYTQKIVKFAAMMTDRGHEVFIYSGSENDAPGEHIPCYPDLPELPDWDPNSPEWRACNAAAAHEIRQRRRRDDWLCLIAGLCQQPLTWALPELTAVEFGIGYAGVFTPYKVFESYAWMHMVYSAQAQGDIFGTDGGNYDAVIPNYFDPVDFPVGDGSGDYLLYLGRMIGRKGIEIVEAVGKETELEVIFAGSNDDNLAPEYGKYIGPVGPEGRAELMGKARAVMVPTIYVEPFGGAAVEAMMCGTPAITSDFGAFPETVMQGVTGYRCRRMGEYAWAAEHAGDLDRGKVRQHALGYSLDAIAPIYEAYFEHVAGLRGAGFYDMTRRPPFGR